MAKNRRNRNSRERAVPSSTRFSHSDLHLENPRFYDEVSRINKWHNDYTSRYLSEQFSADPYSVDDRRKSHPLGAYRAPKNVNGTTAKVDVSRYNAMNINFKYPHEVVVCAKRKIRREVLHALDLKPKRGKGRSPRRTPLSHIKC